MVTLAFESDAPQIRLKLRMKKKEFQDGIIQLWLVLPKNVSYVLSLVVDDEGKEDEEKADVIINIKELDDVLIKDVGNHISSSGK